ncbi:hypothetical protein ZIOFF_052932 [Zingiber officinale]|uniref:Uncharacterized protein n=1 Tax=Zingiber officinale TaxID=94328 RepID=A0A8J5FHV3_ZINOF|nr:hypothetical protein ZIOFF_052932 [Zingiber officinale]
MARDRDQLVDMAQVAVKDNRCEIGVTKDLHQGANADQFTERVLYKEARPKALRSLGYVLVLSSCANAQLLSQCAPLTMKLCSKLLLSFQHKFIELLPNLKSRDSVLHAPHLLSPTGNLQRHGTLGTVFAGYHYDLNFLTIHGRSRFPGLNIWLRNGQKMEVKVPFGCLLIQNGKQLEWLTAGECLAGMHEVVVTNRTLEAIESARQQSRSLWRVSSTLFGHIASGATLKPVGHFADTPLASKYPPICAGDYVEQEVAAIIRKG